MNVSVDMAECPFEEEIDESTGSPLKSQRYVAKVKRLELSNHPQYGPGVRWVMTMFDPEAKKIVEGFDGAEYEFWQTSGTKINTPKPGAKASKQYRWACAFLGRTIQKGESASQVARDLLGKKAEVFLGPNESGTGMQILTADPLGTNLPQFKASANGAAKPAAKTLKPEPEPEPAPKYDETGAELLEF